LGITASIAVSGNFHASVALAKGLSPNSIQVVSKGEESKALAQLPLTVLDLTEEQAKTFALWGICTLGLLAALPERELIARMGQAGKQLRQLARGKMPHLFQPFEPPLVLAEHMELESPLEALDSLMFVMNIMLEQLILRATARGLALASVSVTLTLEGNAVHARTVRSSLPSNDRQVWIKLLHLDLETHPPPAAILAVALKAEPGSASKMQLGLFSPQLPEPARLDVTLARIRAIVGEGNVGRAILEDTHRPDGSRLGLFRISAPASSEFAPMQTRLARRRLRPPQVTFVSLQDERPAAFVFQEQRYSVERAYGPWLTSGDWWSPTLWGWEQWDLVGRARNGALLFCCLVRDLLREQWQMVALYD
jgi:protein ImuB